MTIPKACSCRKWSQSSTELLAHLGLGQAQKGVLAEGIAPHERIRIVGAIGSTLLSSMFLALAWRSGRSCTVVYTAEAQPGEPMVAGWQVLFTKTFLSLADHWQGGFGVPAVADGAERSYLAALLSVLLALSLFDRPAGGRPCARRRRRPSAGTGDVMVAVDLASGRSAYSVPSQPAAPGDGAALPALVRDIRHRRGAVRQLRDRRHRVRRLRQRGAELLRFISTTHAR